MTIDKPADKHLSLEMPLQIRDRLQARATREGITPAQALENSLSIGMLSHNYAEATTEHEGGYGYLKLSPRDTRQLARMPWL